MNNFVSAIFCVVCGSRYVEIMEWSNSGKSVIRCRTCGASEQVSNFTLGRCSVSNTELQKARDTRAVKGKYGENKPER